MPQQPRTAGRLRQALGRWADTADQDARDLQRDSAPSGVASIADAGNRERVTLWGELRTVTLRPRGGVPALEAELYDGTDALTVVWLGRRRIAGVAPGRSLRVTGRIGLHDGVRLMYNPRYELLPEAR
ncbi:OB-fold nucleic acid binding domain-containing protein [Nocardioides limicola]|uniref:OB-fold nucleic acid binding domain-containing protein n=1 Tax=Nocardioides limicola TaxID=2803368 RepID=UPI00193B7406|nr:OB-fold nucleic acid binding domain-containing protein [Nocardioides sp. DJM-14]